MNTHLVDLHICVRGRPLPEYLHDGRTFIEGRAGTEYVLRLRNRSPQRVEVVLTVDGINIITGKEGAFAGEGYVLDPYQTSDIKGFLREGGKAAAFTFGTSAESYRAKLGRGDSHLGVIGVAVFEERRRRARPNRPFVIIQERPHPAYPWWLTYPYTPPLRTAVGADYEVDPTYPEITWGSGPLAIEKVGEGAGYSVYCMATPSEADSAEASAPQAFGAVGDSRDSGGGRDEPMALSSQNLGTGYGQEVDFSTHTSHFRRSNKHPAAVAEVFYDDAEGLREKGIDVGKVRPVPAVPSSFPDEVSSCPAPPGWEG